MLLPSLLVVSLLACDVAVAVPLSLESSSTMLLPRLFCVKSFGTPGDFSRRVRDFCVGVDGGVLRGFRNKKPCFAWLDQSPSTLVHFLSDY